MSIVPVALGERSYDVHIAPGLLDRAREHLRSFIKRDRLIIVSDEQVWAAQGERLAAALDGLELVPVLVPPGEGSKSWAVLGLVVD
ncbi:MAG TPA: 3-dehydroquinate synthase, partial [Sphingomicrobium sp.]